VISIGICRVEREHAPGFDVRLVQAAGTEKRSRKIVSCAGVVVVKGERLAKFRYRPIERLRLGQIHRDCCRAASY
jgi:hypothetical protein